MDYEAGVPSDPNAVAEVLETLGLCPECGVKLDIGHDGRLVLFRSGGHKHCGCRFGSFGQARLKGFWTQNEYQSR